MPMAEVYSALSKGGIDGVVAPSDTLLALHFSDVARHLYGLQIARGGYPARAISDKAYLALPPELRAVLDRDGPVWEALLAREVRRAEGAGASFGRSQGVTFTPASPQDQQRFDQAETAVAEADAEKLRSIAAPGPEILALAQARIAADRSGKAVSCARR
jgi:TRAP-type C4-dicarboxylate transport system substrate-binding protein